MELAALLRVGLAWKLAGANLLIALTAVAAAASGHRDATDPLRTLLIVSGAIGAALIVNFSLIQIALRPLHALEKTVERVMEGDFAARVPPSVIADDEMTRVASLVNVLLDNVSSDRVRMRQLASNIIDASDRQRAAVAHELHDSTAQTLAAVMMQIGAAAREAANPALAARLNMLHDSLQDLIEEVRLLARDIHPRVLEDLGLVAALRELARETTRSSGIDIVVDGNGDASLIPLPVASGLFRVAEEALTNAVRHANPRHIRIVLSVSEAVESPCASLEIADDGDGFDVGVAESTRSGSGLFEIRERLALVNGSCEIRSIRGNGTRVLARVPLVPKRSLAGVSV